MKNTMKDHLKNRFKTAFDELYERNYFKNKKSFALSLDITPQFLSQLLNDTTPIPLQFIAKFIENYPINPSFLFSDTDNNVFKHDAPHLISQGTGLKFIDRPSVMSQKKPTETTKNNGAQNTENTAQNQANTNNDFTELAGLFYRVSQANLEIARIFDRMFQKSAQVAE